MLKWRHQFFVGHWTKSVLVGFLLNIWKKSVYRCTNGLTTFEKFLSSSLKSEPMVHKKSPCIKCYEINVATNFFGNFLKILQDYPQFGTNFRAIEPIWSIFWKIFGNFEFGFYTYWNSYRVGDFRFLTAEDCLQFDTNFRSIESILTIFFGKFLKFLARFLYLLEQI